MHPIIEFVLLSLIFMVPLRFLVRASQPQNERPCGWGTAYLLSVLAVGITLTTAPIIF